MADARTTYGTFAGDPCPSGCGALLSGRANSAAVACKLCRQHALNFKTAVLRASVDDEARAAVLAAAHKVAREQADSKLAAVVGRIATAHRRERAVDPVDATPASASSRPTQLAANLASALRRLSTLPGMESILTAHALMLPAGAGRVLYGIWGRLAT